MVTEAASCEIVDALLVSSRLHDECALPLRGTVSSVGSEQIGFFFVFVFCLHEQR